MLNCYWRYYRVHFPNAIATLASDWLLSWLQRWFMIFFHFVFFLRVAIIIDRQTTHCLSSTFQKLAIPPLFWAFREIHYIVAVYSGSDAISILFDFHNLNGCVHITNAYRVYWNISISLPMLPSCPFADSNTYMFCCSGAWSPRIVGCAVK